MSSIETRLLQLMLAKKASQTELASAIGVTRQTIAQYCKAETQPTASKICAMASFFGVTTDYLLGYDGGGQDPQTRETTFGSLYKLITEIRETSEVKEVAQMLHSGNWIAICATKAEPYVFCLGRISPEADAT